MISLGILSVGLVGAMRVFPVGLRASQRAEMISRAAITAQRTVESLKLSSWEELVEGETTADDGEFQVTTRITQPDLEDLVDPTRLKAIEIVVQWQQDGRPRAMTLVTYVRHEAT